ncbi:hypothetical protein D1P53_002746 [Cryptococcus gattii VGV]|nr:hypothetical protein D1P53_002746 [Cryptococcus gattii VGV]
MSSTWYNRELVETANSLNTGKSMFTQSPSLLAKEMTIAELADFEAENGESELHRQRMLACERRIRYEALIGETVEGEKFSYNSSFQPHRTPQYQISSRSPAHIPSSPVPSLPLPPLPKASVALNDFIPRSFSSSPGVPVSRGDTGMRASESDHRYNQPNDPGLPNLGQSLYVRTLRRESSMEALRRELAIASLTLRVSKRSSNSSMLSNLSTSCDSYSCSESDTQIGEAVLQDPSLAFQPQALPYPKVKSALSRLSIDSASSESMSIVLGNDTHSAIKPLTATGLQALSCDSSPNKSPECYSASRLGIWPSKNYPSPLEARRKVRLRSSLAMPVTWPERTEEEEVPTKVSEAVRDQPTLNRCMWEETSPSPKSRPRMISPEPQLMEEEGGMPHSIQPSPQAEEKGRARSDSSLSAIAAFPLPPVRTEAPQIKSAVTSIAKEKEMSQILQEKEKSATVLSGENVCPSPPLVASLLSVDQNRKNVRAGKGVRTDDSPKMDTGFSNLTVSERRPSSPELHELINNMRKTRKKRNGANGQTEEETDESDLDLSTPLTKLAVNMKIVAADPQRLHDRSSACSFSSGSSYSTSSPSDMGHPMRTGGVVLKNDRLMTSDYGWSEIESEEDAWNEAMEKRKSQKVRPSPNSNIRPRRAGRNTTPSVKSTVHIDEEATPKCSQAFFYHTPIPIPSFTPRTPSTEVKRLSEVSSPTRATTNINSTEGSITSLSLFGSEHNVPMSYPFSSTSTASSTLDDFPWDASSSPSSPIQKIHTSESRLTPRRSSISPSSTASDKETMVKNRKAAILRSLPRPLRDIEGWGEPEILFDDITWEAEPSPNFKSTFYDEYKPVFIQVESQSSPSLKPSKLQEFRTLVENKEDARRRLISKFQHADSRR